MDYDFADDLRGRDLGRWQEALATACSTLAFALLMIALAVLLGVSAAKGW